MKPDLHGYAVKSQEPLVLLAAMGKKLLPIASELISIAVKGSLHAEQHCVAFWIVPEMFTIISSVTISNNV